MESRVRIYPKRKPIDIERLAQALLDLVEYQQRKAQVAENDGVSTVVVAVDDHHQEGGVQ